MNDSYRSLFKKNLIAFANNNPNKEKEYTAFYPIVGKNYNLNNHLLVIGQAVNGWLSSGFKVTDDETALDAHIELSLQESQAEGEECALNWVNTNWVSSGLYRSFFWNVIYKLVKQKYSQTDENWNEVIAWSNLMKIAPQQGWNPDDEEINAQEYAAALFMEELSQLKPKNVILFTNLETWAKPIFEKAGIAYETHPSGFIQATATYGNSRIIVTQRTRMGMNHQNCIDELMKEMV
ncbi:hypothetical protein [Runella sp.]|uniref:hypothetical protein n=1 Tax=Runella sp. TaxID=1960881 RepID=UPI003D122533